MWEEAFLIGQIDFNVWYGDKTTGKACRRWICTLILVFDLRISFPQGEVHEAMGCGLLGFINYHPPLGRTRFGAYGVCILVVPIPPPGSMKPALMYVPENETLFWRSSYL